MFFDKPGYARILLSIYANKSRRSYSTIQPAQQAWAQLGQPDLQVGLHTLVEVAPIHEDGLQLGL